MSDRPTRTHDGCPGARSLRAAPLALLALALAAPAAALQSDTGTVFENTHLPFEALKAPPDSAFDIVMVSVGVFLLVWLSVAAFLVLAKLDSIQQLLQTRETAAKAEEAARIERAAALLGAVGQQSAGAEGPAADLGDALVGLRAAVDASADRLEKAIGTLAGQASSTAGSAEGDGALRSAVEALVEQQREQSRGLEAALANGLAGLTGGAAAPAPIGGPVPLRERVRTHLAALGYTHVQFIDDPSSAPSGATDGELVVEARRGSSPYKGRVLLEGGAIADVQLRSGHQIFP